MYFWILSLCFQLIYNPTNKIHFFWFLYKAKKKSEFYIHLRFFVHALTLRYFLFASSNTTNMKLHETAIYNL